MIIRKIPIDQINPAAYNPRKNLQPGDPEYEKLTTQKPLQVITPFIEKYSDEDSNIVDIYGGSGSTLIACEQLSRTSYVMELDPKYCDVIVQRWEDLTGQKAELEVIT